MALTPHSGTLPTRPAEHGEQDPAVVYRFVSTPSQFMSKLVLTGADAQEPLPR